MNSSTYPECYHWRKTADGLWRRDIDELEQFYTTFCRNPKNPDYASFPVTCHASFIIPKSDDDSIPGVTARVKDAFRRAWGALRVEHPMIASWTQMNPESGHWEKCYAPFEDTENDGWAEHQWLDETFRTVQMEKRDEWINTNPPTFKLPTVFFASPLTNYKDGFHGAVYLRFPHDVIDGIGILHTLNRLVELASCILTRLDITLPPRSSENDRLSIPVRVVSKIAQHATEAQKNSFKALVAQNQRLQSEKPFLGLLMTEGSHSDGTQRVSVTLPEAMLGSLMEKCKDRKLTITHAVSAAILIALRDSQPSGCDTRDWRYSNHALLNLRSHLLPTDGFVVGNYHMLAPNTMAIDVNSSLTAIQEELISVANQFRDYYTKVRLTSASNNDLLDFAPKIWDLFTPKPSSPRPVQPPTAPVAISSLGNICTVVKLDHHPIKITNVWVAGEPLGAGISTFLRTWSNVLSISMLFNAAFHKKESIEKFQRKILDIIAGMEL